MSFQLNPQQVKEAEAFIEVHLNCALKNHSSIGGSFSYRFVPVTVGMLVGIKCLVCGDHGDLSENLHW